jgi:membrane protein
VHYPVVGMYSAKVAAARRWAAPYVERVDESIVGQWYSRLLELEIVDRSVALAAKLFVAFFPFVLGVASLLPSSVARSIRLSLVNRFGLSGEGLKVVAGAFATSGQTRAATGLLGGILLFFYATSFTTALQRVYLRAWRRPAGGGVRNQSRGLAWLGGILALFAINGFVGRLLVGQAGSVLQALLSFVTGTCLWWWTARTMLRAEVRWRPLLPGAVCTAAAMTTYLLSSPVWMPRTVQNNSAQFGFFGVSLSLVTWFVGASFTIIASAALCPVLAESDSGLARSLRGDIDDALVAGAPPALAGPTRRPRLIDALGIRELTGRSPEIEDSATPPHQ